MNITEDLIKDCIAQNRMAQKQLYHLLLPYLRAVASRYLRDISYVKDVLQESFIKVFKHIDRYDPQRAPLKKWATRIVINCCINYNRRVIDHSSEELITDQHEIVCFPQSIKNLTNEHLLFVLKQMPAGYFEVLNLFAIEGYQHDEIAKMLGITEVLSRKRLSRARAWIKKTFPENKQSRFDFISLPNKIK